MTSEPHPVHHEAIYWIELVSQWNEWQTFHRPEAHEPHLLIETPAPPLATPASVAAPASATASAKPPELTLSPEATHYFKQLAGQAGRERVKRIADFDQAVVPPDSDQDYWLIALAYWVKQRPRAIKPLINTMILGTIATVQTRLGRKLRASDWGELVKALRFAFSDHLMRDALRDFARQAKPERQLQRARNLETPVFGDGTLTLGETLGHPPSAPEPEPEIREAAARIAHQAVRETSFVGRLMTYLQLLRKDRGITISGDETAVRAVVGLKKSAAFQSGIAARTLPETLIAKDPRCQTLITEDPACAAELRIHARLGFFDAVEAWFHSRAWIAEGAQAIGRPAGYLDYPQAAEQLLQLIAERQAAVEAQYQHEEAASEKNPPPRPEMSATSLITLLTAFLLSG
jgi:hypothetical protein